jgi:hypothetical protein
MAERGIECAHTTIIPWGERYIPESRVRGNTPSLFSGNQKGLVHRVLSLAAGYPAGILGLVEGHYYRPVLQIQFLGYLLDHLSLSHS